MELISCRTIGICVFPLTHTRREFLGSMEKLETARRQRDSSEAKRTIDFNFNGSLSLSLLFILTWWKIFPCFSIPSSLLGSRLSYRAVVHRYGSFEAMKTEPQLYGEMVEKFEKWSQQSVALLAIFKSRRAAASRWWRKKKKITEFLCI